MKFSTPRSIVVAVSAFCFVALVSSCTPATETVLPTGPQTLTGALSSVELSLTRRGTHILRQNGRDVYYVESSVVNLRSYEGMDVVLTGTLEKNTNVAYLPVLVATEAVLIEEPSHPWSVPALHLMFAAPVGWSGRVFDDGISFTQAGSSQPLLKVFRSSLAELPAGTPLVVGGERAVRIDTASGQVVYVQNGKDVLSVTLDKTLAGPTGKDPVQSVLQLLKSITFTNAPSSGSGASVRSTGTGSMTGAPCGGAAGILCPPGNYCAITDSAQGIGVCRSFGQQ